MMTIVEGVGLHFVLVVQTVHMCTLGRSRMKPAVQYNP